MFRSARGSWPIWRRSVTRTASVIMLALICSVVRAQSVATLLEKGIYEEETAGNLDGAIAIYTQIVAQADAARPQVAQATYRLGLCQIKQGNQAEGLATLEKLISTFPEQETLVAQARKYTSDAQQGLSDADVAKVVEDAVETISTCTETDPRIKDALSSLSGLDDQLVVKSMATFLEDQSNTIRRAAIYILWQGDFKDISSATDGLLKLLSHEEDLTRGMAGLALGQRKVASAFPILCKMTLEDQSGYARRCAAYALGLMGRADAQPVLEKALKDPESLVSTNAEAALIMLSKVSEGATRPEYKQTHRMELNADGSGSVTSDVVKKNNGKISMETDSFVNGTPDLKVLGEDGQPLKMEVKKEQNYYRFKVILDRPIPPGGERTLRNVWKADHLATERDGIWTYSRNHTPCPPTDYVETVVLPPGAEIISVEPTPAKTLDEGGRKSLRFEEILKKMEAFRCRIKYRLPKG